MFALFHEQPNLNSSWIFKFRQKWFFLWKIFSYYYSSLLIFLVNLTKRIILGDTKHSGNILYYLQPHYKTNQSPKFNTISEVVLNLQGTRGGCSASSPSIFLHLKLHIADFSYNPKSLIIICFSTPDLVPCRIKLFNFEQKRIFWI